MDPALELLFAFAILIGLIGIVTPVLPGLLLIVGSVFIWAMLTGGPAWVVAGFAVVVAGVGTWIKYSIPRRQLAESGIPTRTIVLATGVAIVGLFAIPVVGAAVGFVLTIYLFERRRVGVAHAWPATGVALRAVLTSVGLELAAGMLIAAAWLVAVAVL